MWNWRTQVVVFGLAAGAIIGAALGAWLAPRLEASERYGRFNVGAAIFAGAVGAAGLIVAIIVNV
ncbi:MAG: hypothetical protein ACKOTH_07290 [Solirubrobacterales bacterium]